MSGMRHRLNRFNPMEHGSEGKRGAQGYGGGCDGELANTNRNAYYKRSQMDGQQKEVENKSTTHYSRHQKEYNKYHQKTEIYDEYYKKRLSFMQVIEKQKKNVTQKEKEYLWNQFWTVELNNSEEKCKQRQNQLLRPSLKKNENFCVSNPVEKNPSSYGNYSNEFSSKCIALKEISLIDSEETVKIKKYENIHLKEIDNIDLKEKAFIEEKNQIKNEFVDIMDAKRTTVKEKKKSPIENIATKKKQETDSKIESDLDLGTSLRKEPLFDYDLTDPISFGRDDQFDSETFVKDLDKLSTEYAPIGFGLEDSNFSCIPERVVNPKLPGSLSNHSGRIRSPEFNFGDPQEFYFQNKINVNQDYSTIKTQFEGSKGVSLFNSDTEIKSENFLNHQVDTTTSGTKALEINQKEKQSESFQTNFKVKDALNTIQCLSKRLTLLGPPLINYIDKILSQSSDSIDNMELLYDKDFLLLLRAAANAFRIESARVNNQIVNCLLEAGKKQALDLIEYVRYKQSICIHGIDIEEIAKRTIYNTTEECIKNIEKAIMYETNSSFKPSEDIVKEIFHNVSILHYKLITN